MEFYIIGTGNTAWFFGTGLVKAGHTCKGVWGRDAVKAGKLASELTCPPLSKLSDIADDADSCIMAISDYAIPEITEQLSFRQTTLLHTAGSVARDVLDRSSTLNGVIWPIYSIVKDSLPEHRSVPIITEASDAQTAARITSFISSISDTQFEASWQQRQWLHLCAVLNNNFTNHLMAISEQLCEAEGVPFNLLQPIIQQTAERIKGTSPLSLQTGPAKRGDEKTIEQHMSMLQRNADWQRIYETLTTSIKNTYRPNGEEKTPKP